MAASTPPSAAFLRDRSTTQGSGADDLWIDVPTLGTTASRNAGRVDGATRRHDPVPASEDIEVPDDDGPFPWRIPEVRHDK